MLRLLIFSCVVFFLMGCSPSAHSPISAIPPDTTTDKGAHWLSPTLILMEPTEQSAFLVSSDNATLDDVKPPTHSFPLSPIDTPDWVLEKYPHLSSMQAFQTKVAEQQAKTLLKHQLAVVRVNDQQKVTHLSYVQNYGVLDVLYTQGEQDADEHSQFGATQAAQVTRFSLWAPTAKKAEVLLFNPNKQPLPSSPLSMQEDPDTGIWHLSTDAAPMGTYYRYRLTLYHPQNQAIEVVEVTDPYSLSLSTNSRFSQVVDLTHADTQPAGWGQHVTPTVAAPESNVFYEVHIRDFSATDGTLSKPEFSGKYKAFSESSSDGIRHLKALGAAGLNNVHLLPTFDISTVNEQASEVLLPSDSMEKVCQHMPSLANCMSQINPEQTLADVLSAFDPASGHAQHLVTALREKDPYNWGYDPFHYTVPEGSYALHPDGIPRLVEFRQMVQSLHELGFRVIMDVVYNHTYESGLRDKSVLDKIVPDYYHRLHPIDGSIEQSTCCDNTATEHRMMAKLMIDSLVVWARDYRIDGFRFDLMGHQPKAAMLEALEAVRKVDPDTYFYGEGWNFGEVANNAQFVQASQQELAGTEIGTFTDRLRDAVRGGSSFVSGDDIRQGQGIGNGLVTWPNELQNDLNKAQMEQEYRLSMDQIRVGLAANLADFPLVNADGVAVTGKDIDYGGQAAGYALDPADTINYVSKHDNQTLWDNNQYRIPFDASTEQRVRFQTLSLAYPLLAQGIPFIHMGSELLRSKSFLRDSYDYADWFNAVDFSKTTNHYNVGLPPRDKDEANWPLIKNLLAQNDQRDQVSAEHIQQSSAAFMDLLAIRTSSPLFSLTTAAEIIDRVAFHNTGAEQQTGLIVMSISDDGKDQNLDPELNEILVLFNNDVEPKSFPFEGAQNFELHPRLANGSDSVVKQSRGDNTGFYVPPLSVAVFVR